MNPKSFQCRLALVASLCLLPLSLALASPGAHGPNGEHLDSPVAQSAGSGLPHVEAHSEQFEMVGRLEAAGFVLYVSRYETNEAVLGGQVDVELGNLKARAAFEAESGSYRVTDKKLVEALHQAGNHALVFTVTVGADSDLLDGTLAVTAHDDNERGHAEGGGWRRSAAIAAGVGLLVLGGVLLRRRRNAFGAAR